MNKNLTAKQLNRIIRCIQSDDIDRANAAKQRLISLNEQEVRRVLASMRPNPRARYAVTFGPIVIFTLWCAILGWRYATAVPQFASLIFSAIHALYIRKRKNQFAYALEVLVSAQKPAILPDRIRALQSSDTRVINAVIPGVIEGITEASDTDLNLLTTEVVSVLTNCLLHQYTPRSLVDYYTSTEPLDLELCNKLDIAILNRAVAMPSARMVSAVKYVIQNGNVIGERRKLAKAVLPQLLEAEERRKSGEGLLRIPRDHGVEPASELLRPNTEAEQQNSGRG